MSMADADISETLCERVRAAVDRRSPLSIAGSGSKAFLHAEGAGSALDVRAHRGVVHYAPEELVLSVRAGTPLAEVEALLSAHDQMLAFDPPHYGADATIGGTLAAGVSGPGRAAAGSARDFVLGTRIINGRGQALRFGGEVIKNVAGYDVSRLMVGSFGTLGVILEASFKVHPRPPCERSLVQAVPTAAAAVKAMRQWALTALPITASAWLDGRLYWRLSGSEPAMAHAVDMLGGEALPDAVPFWQPLREQELAFFADPRPLWRIATPPAAPLLPEALVAAEDRLVEWNGALRWVRSTSAAREIFAAAAALGGHAMLYRYPGSSTARRQPLSSALLALHQRVKAALDPHGVFNPDRLYPGI